MSGIPKYEDARYNVVSVRISQKELEQLDKLRGERSRGDMIYPVIKALLNSSGKSEPV